uniref:Protein kinase domain-containing protein n=1 Tax=Leersia perrieri TaxID=77586 RepID=A0A0D9XCS3_9ORYZ
MVRVMAMYGNYDGKDSASTLQFDLYLGVHYWVTVHADSAIINEALFVAWASWVPVCLVRTSPGSTPYNDDPYDRWWLPMPSKPTWRNISTESPIELSSTYAVPLPVIQTAVEAVSNNTTLSIIWQDRSHKNEYKAYLHFADFQNTELRQFNIYVHNKFKVDLYSPSYLAPSVVISNPGWYKSDDIDGTYNITLKATATSKLPPMINGLEAYTRIYHVNPQTDLSNSNLHGPISNNFTLLTMLQSLNLSGNQLNGPIPDAFCKGSFIFSFDSEKDTCNPPNPINKSKKAVIVTISVLVPVMAIGALVAAYLIWRTKRKPNVSSNDPPREQEIEIAPASRKEHEDALQKVENRRFTYMQLEKLTNKFHKLIGQGGFGLVYYGRLEDGIEVAVKIRSETSSHGLDEFLAEVQSLTKVHHRNLVSLVGYCWEKDKLALVYEYMAQGSLYDRLRGNNDVRETLSWRTRVGIVVEAAQETVSGEPPILPGQGHITERVKKKIATGNISLVADARLGGAYDVSSVWKVVDIALLCTADIGAQRPTMAAVIVQLKESLALEQARADSGFGGSTSRVSDSMFSTSTFYPSAR